MLRDVYRGFYYVYTRDSALLATAMLKRYSPTSAELGCLVVDPAYRKQGRGDAMLSFIERTAIAAGVTEIFALSTRTMQWCEPPASCSRSRSAPHTAPRSPLTAAPRPSLVFWAGAALYQLGTPLYAPTVPTMLLQCVPRHRRGSVMGLDEAINTVARVGAPLLFGQLYHTLGAAAAFGAAGSAVLFAAVIAVLRRMVVLRSSYA